MSKTAGKTKRSPLGRDRLGLWVSEEKRREIESHVVHTKHHLDRIPWPKHLERVPEIAYAHHERLDGKGYPEGFAGAIDGERVRISIAEKVFEAIRRPA